MAAKLCFGGLLHSPVSQPPRSTRSGTSPARAFQVQLGNEDAGEWKPAAEKSSHRMIGFVRKRRIEE